MFTEIPDAKGTHNHNNHHIHGHTSKHNTNDVYKSHKQQQSQPNQVYSNQRTPKVTHPAIVSDDDDRFGSAEDYDDADLSPNIFLRPTKTSSDDFGTNNNNHHYPYQNSNGNGNNARFNIPLLNPASGHIGNGINGNAINGNNGIATGTEVRSYDNRDVTSATASVIFIQNTHQFDYHSILFTINLVISVFVPLLAT